VSELEEIRARLEELESQAAFQDELHARLNEVVARQDRELADLKVQLKGLAGRLREIGEVMPGSTPDPADEVPPHY
jgi:SlyX protein